MFAPKRFAPNRTDVDDEFFEVRSLDFPLGLIFFFVLFIAVIFDILFFDDDPHG